MAVAAFSASLAFVPAIDLRLPGMAYFLLDPLRGGHGDFSGRRWASLVEKHPESERVVS